MKRKITSLVLTAALLTMTGCYSENSTETTKLAAYIENPPEGTDSKFYITYDEWHNEYLFNMARNSYDEEADTDIVQSLKQDILDYQAQEHVILYFAEQEGITAETLTEEELAGIEETVQGIWDNWCNDFEAEAKEALGDIYTEDELYEKEFELFTAFMEESGLTPDIFRVWNTNQVLKDKFIKKAAESVSDQDVEDFVQETIDDAKNVYENNPEIFEQTYTAFYVPEGTRIVQHIYVKIDEDAAAEIQACRDDGDDEKAEELLETALESVRPVIEEAYEKLQNGEEWLAVQEEYNQDVNGNNVDYVIYPVSAYISEYVVNAAMGIAEKGGVSDIVTGETGCFIFYYKDDRVFSEQERQNLLDQARSYLMTQKAYEKMYDFMEQYPYVYDYELMGITQ